MATLKLRGKVWYSYLFMNGKRVQRALSSDKRIAQQKLDDLVLLRRAGKYGEIPSTVSWSFFKSRYKEFSEANKCAQTVYRDELAFRMMEDVMPITRLNQVTPELLERLKFKWQKAGKTLSVVTRAIKSLKTAMRVSEGWKYTQPQPWHSVKVREPEGRLLWYTVDQLKDLINVCHGPWKTLVLLMSRAGLRRGEAYNLEWSDVDFKRHRIWVHTKSFWNPKNRKERYVDMSDDLEHYLMGLEDKISWVIGQERMTLGSMDVYFRRLVRKAKLKGSAHTLRHTFASHLVSNGVGLPEIGKLLGHSNPKTTNIYAHLSPQATQEAIEKLPSLGASLVPGSSESVRFRLV